MNIIPFKTDDFSIRVIEIQGEPWFVGKDIAEALGYSDTVNAIKLTKGGMQKVRLINEPDLFRLIVNSQLPAAEQFEKWVFEEVLPTIRKTGGYQSKPTKPQPPLKQLSDAARAFKAVFQSLRVLDLNTNAAAISANQAVRQQTDLDFLAITGNTHLKAENQQSLHYTPTQLGEQLGGLSGKRINRALQAAGLQTQQGKDWKPTEQGRPHAFLADTGRAHSSGIPIQQLKWYDSVLPFIEHLIHQKEAA